MRQGVGKEVAEAAREAELAEVGEAKVGGPHVHPDAPRPTPHRKVGAVAQAVVVQQGASQFTWGTFPGTSHGRI